MIDGGRLVEESETGYRGTHMTEAVSPSGPPPEVVAEIEAREAEEAREAAVTDTPSQDKSSQSAADAAKDIQNQRLSSDKGFGIHQQDNGAKAPEAAGRDFSVKCRPNPARRSG